MAMTRARVVWILVAIVAVAGLAIVLRPSGPATIDAGGGGGVAPALPLADPSRLPGASSNAPPKAGPLVPMKAIDLNVASEAELQTLPGITADYAHRIAAGRPYKSIEEIQKTGVPKAVLERISPPATLVIRDAESPRTTPGRP